VKDDNPGLGRVEVMSEVRERWKRKKEEEKLAEPLDTLGARLHSLTFD
jgi:hypothetical protein